MNRIHPSRRRFLGIVAATGALAASPWGWQAALAASDIAPVTWRGIALGADAQLQIHHPDRSHAETLIHRAVTEARRLENILSLYQPDSALSRLNRDGRLEDAPSDLLQLLRESHDCSLLTDGAFDPSVQVLWMLHARAVEAGSGLPTDKLIEQALKRVDYRAVEVQGRSVRLGIPGMALTLNGIAQGYITDRITELLRDGGLDHALVDMGEIRGLNGNPANRPWRVGLADDSPERKPLQMVEIRNRAISTSAGRGTLLDPAGRATHIFDPRSGRSTPRYRSVSVEAGNATTADAFSTAFSVMAEDDIRRVARTRAITVRVLRAASAQYVTLA